MIRLAKSLALVAALVAIGCAVKPVSVATYPVMDSVRVVVSPEANKEIEQIARLTRRTRKEQSACVTSYAVVPVHGAVIVAIEQLGPSRPYDSDSLRVWTLDQQPFCDNAAASLHTHIVNNEAWGHPSEWDVIHAFDWTIAPFKVLVSVPAKGPSKLTVYGVR